LNNADTPSKTLDQTIAISLQYEGEGAPVVSAKGTGVIAQQILDLAAEHNIPITQDAQLTELLSQVELDAEIPELLYEAVAQVLVFAYQLSNKEFPNVKKTSADVNPDRE